MFKKFNLIYLVLLIFTIAENNSISETIDLYSKYQYEINTPKKIKINIVGKDYIKYLKQIKQVSKKDNLNSKVVNSSQKKWIKSKVFWNKSLAHNAKIKLHGDWNDHISLPYSSLKVKSNGKYFGSLKEFILFKPITRNYNSEIFATTLMQSLGFLAPYTSTIEVKINDYPSENYLIQEKINKNFIERAGFREAPIIEYDERSRWNSVNLNEDLNNIKFANIYKLDNESYIENPNKEQLNTYKIFLATQALSDASKGIDLNSKENIFFEVTMSLMDACHGIIDHNRKFYYEAVHKKFIPIYYDGMAFDYNKDFCLVYRKTKNDFFFNLDTLKFLSTNLLNDNFKKNIKKKYLTLVINDDDKFDIYWKKLLKNFFKYKEITLSKNNNIPNQQINNNNIFHNLKKLNPYNYPLIYYYVSKKNEYIECIDWKKTNYKDIFSTNEHNYIKSKKKTECKVISKYRFTNNIKNKNFYYIKNNKNNKNIKIYPIFLGNEKYETALQKDFIDLNPNKNDIFLVENKTYFLISNNKRIEEINIISKNSSQSSVVIIGKNLEVGTINYLEIIPADKENTLIQKLNITGCINIYDSIFKIDLININNASCEDALNIVRSTGEINNILINNTIS